MSESTEITVSSKSLLETCPGIPETMLFIRPYCSNALIEDSLDITLIEDSLEFTVFFS